ncbi:MAG: hypothetical protein EHM75_07095 [Desulfobacteraceae bacterium]|nr:MAG: hypothetical protein EHM75_07095 [Desulfobacteraceae bacterium]
MADSFISTPLNQTTPVERLRDSKREAVDRYGKRPRPKKPEGQAPMPEEKEQSGVPDIEEESKKSGKILDIVI